MFVLGINVSHVDFELADLHVGAKCSRVTHFELDHLVGQFQFGEMSIEEEHFVEERMVRSFANLSLFGHAEETHSTDGIDVTSFELSTAKNLHADLKVLSFARASFRLARKDRLGIS